jgi:4-diphosphocytidyl-2-C-methyl-D-erythritol kinase
MKILAPAKVNLYLRVVGRTKDGYHLIDSVMVPVNLCDQIEITRLAKPRGLEVTCDHPGVPAGNKNIAFQAAALVLERQRIQAGIRIHIRKKIPVGAGLGGGSSDAAATLLGLNRLFRLKLSRKKLADLASQLGSDVPFFIHACPARVRGKGERLSFLRSFPRLWLVIVYPGFPVSTGWVYRNFRLKLTKAVDNTSITGYLRRRDRLSKLLVNDLETVTIERYPRLTLLKEKLRHEGAVGVLMAGSGSSVFGIFGSRKKARLAFHHLRKEERAQAYLVHSLG